MSFYTEVPLVTTHVVYNYLQKNPFRSYGETCIILVQNIILVGLLWTYSKPTPSLVKILTVVAVFASVAIVSFNLPAEYQVTVCCMYILNDVDMIHIELTTISHSTWYFLQYILPLTNLPMLLLSKCPQIYKNMMNKHTGQLSLPTTFLTFAGSMARIFTTIQDVGYDAALLCNCTANATLSGVLVIQVT